MNNDGLQISMVCSCAWRLNANPQKSQWADKPDGRYEGTHCSQCNEITTIIVERPTAPPAAAA